MIPRVLVIAGSDSGGGAGIQADIKTVMALGGFATTAITALTAQNTLGVTAVHPVPPEMVIAQIDAVLDDIGADAVKIGMLGSAAVAEAVADRLGGVGVPIVFDPVMVATSGALLADAATVAAFERLIRMSVLVTPNVPELAALTGLPILTEDEGEIAADELVERLGCAVLAKGGHRLPAHTSQLRLADGSVTDDHIGDFLTTSQGDRRFWHDAKINSRHTHGTGCTLASAIATGLGRGETLAEAIGAARDYVRAALLAAPGFGAGHGPMGHSCVSSPPLRGEGDRPA